MEDFPVDAEYGGKKRRWSQKYSPGASATLADTESPSASADIPVPPCIQGEAMTKGPRDRRPISHRGTQSFYPPRGSESGKAASFTAAHFTAGARSAYLNRYLEDITRLNVLPSSVRWVDSHCHLESILERTWHGASKPQVRDNEPLVDLPGLVQLWPSGLDGCISNFASLKPGRRGCPAEWTWLETNIGHFDPGSPVADKLWFTIGVHPHDAGAGSWDASAERKLRRLAMHPKCVAIGECGLDFFRHEENDTERQLKAFRDQARIAVELDKALVVHGRLTNKTNEDLCFNVLREIVPQHHRIHIHCYSDSLQHAKDLCSHWPNLRIGFTGAITFRDPPGKARSKGGKKGTGEKKGEAHCRELVQGLPIDRLLIETDGPYMCPEPFRGQTAHPGHVHRVAEKIAELQQKNFAEVLAATRHSTAVVYRI